MSFILDALRKADAQRERDPARGIHAQAIPASSLAPRKAPPLAGWVIPAVAAGFVLVAWGVWWTMREPAVAPVAMQAAAPVAMQAPAPVATAVAPVEPPMSAQEMNRSVPPMRGTPPTSGIRAQPPALPPAVPLPAPAPAPAPAPGSAPPVNPTATGLPADAPKLAISGGVYSTDPTQRMLIVNGQVFNEGSELAPGVRLAEIRARTAVLEFRGARYSVAY